VNVVKRRWPDLLIGLLVLLLLGGFAALLLGKGRQDTGQNGVVQSANTSQQGTAQGNQSQGVQPSVAPVPSTQSTAAQSTAAQSTATQSTATQTPVPQSPSASGTTPASTSQAGAIPTIPSAPLDPSSPTTPAATTQPVPTSPATAAQPSTSADTVAPQVGGAVSASAARVPTRNDYRISLGSYADDAAVQLATAGVGKLGYTVYPIAVASGVVAQVGPFATREAAAQALADIQRALPGALLYPPRNAPASDAGTGASGSTSTQNSNSASGATPAGRTTSDTPPASGSELAATGPVYLQVGAYNSVKAAQAAVSRVRDLGLEPSVNAPDGKLVTVVVGPFQGRALTDAEAKLQSGGVDSFRVR
jgi:hypothetical protein